MRRRPAAGQGPRPVRTGTSGGSPPRTAAGLDPATGEPTTGRSTPASVDGFHRALAKDLTLTWRQHTVQLTCDNAFHYDLEVTREDVTG
jgi:hypothetical protein